MTKTKLHFHVTPEYFYNGDEPLIFADYAAVNEFLNWTKYLCMVRMVPFSLKEVQ